MATGKTYDRVWCYGKGQFRAAVSFAPNGGSNPDPASFKGSLLQSVTRLSAGTWRLTLNIGGVKDIISADASAQVNSAANIDTSLQVGAITNTGGSPITIDIRNNPGGAVADIAADPSNRINLELFLQMGAIK